MPRVTVIEEYSVEWKTLSVYWTELHKMLHFHPYLLRRSQKTLSEIANLTNCQEFVAVHVRRTDYIGHMMG